MQFKDEDGALRALILNDRNGNMIWAGLGNDKARRKSLENASLWALDGTTGRLLPLGDLRPDLASSARLDTIVEEDGRIVAVSASGSAASAKAPVAPAGQSEKVIAGASAPDADCTVLPRLEALIRQRKEQMPEGSYTTHLFKSGLHKIRKKTGEEAVELVLAKDAPEVVSESADLLYHLLVLLAAWDVPLSDVMGELEKR